MFFKLMTSVILIVAEIIGFFCGIRRIFMLTSLALIFLVGLSMAGICQFLKLPRIIGMLITAPLSAIGIDVSYKRCLQKESA